MTLLEDKKIDALKEDQLDATATSTSEMKSRKRDQKAAKKAQLKLAAKKSPSAKNNKNLFSDS